MRRNLCYLGVALGTGIFAWSGWLPTSYSNAPAQLVKWACGAVSSADEFWEAFGFSGAAVVTAYPYVWAALVVPGAIAGWKADPSMKWIHLICHSAAGLIIVALGTLLRVVHDTWVPVWVQWAAILVPVAFVGAMWAAAFCLPKSRQAAALLLLGMLPQVPIQFLVSRAVVTHEGPGWGYGMGGTAAAWLCVMAILQLRTSGESP